MRFAEDFVNFVKIFSCEKWIILTNPLRIILIKKNI